MSTAAALLDRLGRPGDIRLGAGRPEWVARLPTGLAVLDAALDGGLPRGRLIEITGPPSAGRTGLACAVAAHATRAGETIAWIDPEDALDPAAAAAAGVVLERTLWVRPRDVSDAYQAAALVLRTGGFGLVVLDVMRAHARKLRQGRTSASSETLALARTAERGRSVLLVLALQHRPDSGAAIVLETGARRVCWSGGSGRLVLLDGIEASITIAHSRIGRPGRTLLVRRACA